MGHDDDPDERKFTGPPSPAAVNTRIMIAAIVVLFAVVLFILILHIYARWFWRNARLRARHGGGRSWTRRFGRRRRMRFNFMTVDPAAAANGVVVPSKGLDKTVLESLPIFFYTRKDQAVNKVNGVKNEGRDEEQEEGAEDVLECAVCLSEFEENEAGRRLPKCGHAFHTECIDMWFSSHSTCPLCRTTVGLETGDRDLERAEAVATNNRSQGEQLLREAVVSGLITSSTPASSAVTDNNGTAVAIQILQDEGAILLQEQGSSSSAGPQFPASVLFWGNRTYTNSTSTAVGSSNSHHDYHHHEQQQEVETTTTPVSSPSPKHQRRELIIEIPRRSTGNFASACSSQLPSPTSTEGGQRSPLGAHLRNIKRLLSRESRRSSMDTSPSPVGGECCESQFQFHSACHTPGSTTPTSQC